MSSPGRAILVGGLLALMGTGSVSALEDTDFAIANRAMTEGVVRPVYEELVAAARTMAEDLESYCRGGANEPDQIIQNFVALVGAWGRAQPIAFGPIMDGDGPARFEYWPDRGTGQRQRRSAMAAEDASLLESSSLAGKSVALADITALEAVLRTDDIPAAGSYPCNYAASIASYQHALARDLFDEWFVAGSGYAEQIFDAETGSDVYYTPDEATRDFLKSISVAIDTVIVSKIERPMGENVDAARPTRAEFWRTGLSLVAIEANLETVRALFVVEGGFVSLMTAAGNGPLANGLVRVLGETLDEIRSLEGGMAEAVTLADQRRKLEGIVEQLKSVRLLIDGPMARGLGLIIGFNASDGD